MKWANVTRFALLVIAGMYLLALFALCARAGELPLNPDVTSETIGETICVPGWTKTVRPPVSFTDELKRSEMIAAGIDLKRASEIELDHALPLALGGAPRDRRNLRLQTWAEVAPDDWKIDSAARVKDHLERRLQVLVCNGTIPLEVAQRCIFPNWRACAAKFPSIHVRDEP